MYHFNMRDEAGSVCGGSGQSRYMMGRMGRWMDGWMDRRCNPGGPELTDSVVDS